MIAIVGYGIVGKATHLGLLNNCPVSILDIGINEYQQTTIVNHELIFVCLPTADQDDLDQLVCVCKNLIENNPTAELVIRSTIPVSFVDKLNHVCGNNWSYCPEFLRERHWQSDCAIKPVLVGADQNSKLVALIKDCTVVSRQEAATIKLSVNSFNSLRVVFANHIHDLCQKSNSDYELTISQIRKQINTNPQDYFNVSNNLRGFGGKCLPKDLNILIDDFVNYQLSQTLFSSIQTDNQHWPVTIRKD